MSASEIFRQAFVAGLLGRKLPIKSAQPASEPARRIMHAAWVRGLRGESRTIDNSLHGMRDTQTTEPLLTQSALCRELKLPGNVISRAIARGEIEPDFRAGKFSLFKLSSVPRVAAQFSAVRVDEPEKVKPSGI